MRNTIEVKGGRQNNLRNIDVEIPRDKLTVITGVSGSGKSSLAFDIIYGEGQRRFLDSLPTFSRSRISQVKKPEVDFVFGLSPVIAIQQKRGLVNPRSTVGTMTDIYDYLRLLFATIGKASCPYCGEDIRIKDSGELVELVLSLPKETVVEFSVPVKKIYGEDYVYLLNEIRQKGFNTMIIDGERVDISNEMDLDRFDFRDMRVVVDTFIVSQKIEKSMKNSIETALEVIGENIIIAKIKSDNIDEESEKEFYRKFGCENHGVTMANVESHYFAFNNIRNACRTCSGIGTTKKAEPRLMVANHKKSINEGALELSVYNSNGKSYKNVIMHNLARIYEFSLDEPFSDLSEEAKKVIFYGSGDRKLKMESVPGIDRNWLVGRDIRFSGFVNQIEHLYRESIKKGNVSESMMEWYKKKMIEDTCPDCNGKKLKEQRLYIKVNGRDIDEITRMQLTDVIRFLKTIEVEENKRYVAEPIITEIEKRVNLLLEIGLDYMSLGRRADTISGGEAQRIRLATQISSGLMGMIYVLDEPSIGLHARDSGKVIKILKHLRDIGNTVIVVEHDMETIESADNIIEIGPGPGIHGGTIVEEGSVSEIINSQKSITGKYLKGVKNIEIPKERKKPDGRALSIRGARENNLKDMSIDIPLGMMVCISGVSGSGKSTLVNEIIYKKLRSLDDPRIIHGELEEFSGSEHISNVINIDQSPIGKNSRSNPATYVGIFDIIRKMFAQTSDALERGYTITNFSFNSKNSGRCEHCKGEGRIVTKLQFMPDVHTICPMCKGKKYKKEVLDIKYKGKSIYDVLDMSIETAVEFFSEHKTIESKLKIMEELGLGYLKLGQSSQTLSGGEAQRIKLATELGKIKRGNSNLYILDEPTTGLHISDVKKLLRCLKMFGDKGHSLIIIEHNLEVLKTADYIIDLGPDGGKAGGMIVAQGTPEEVAAATESITGEFLRKVL